MKAIVVHAFGNEDVLQYEEKEMPQPGAGEVRVMMKAVGVNPVETYIRAGRYAQLPSLPYTPGNDGAGIVDAVGEGVSRIAQGERVFVAAALSENNTGTYAQYVVCDADAVHPLPENLSFSQGAGLGTPGLAAANALFCRAKVRSGETVLVHGASGGVGTIAVQLARKHGARVFGTAGDEDGLSLVKALGAHAVFNHRMEGYVDAMIEEAGPGGINAIVEVLADVNLMKDVNMIAKRGRVVVVGSRGSLDFDPRATMAKDAAVLGMGVGNMPKEDFVSNMYALSAAMECGLRTVIAAEVPLDEAARAHREVLGKGKNGKIILTVEADR